MRVRISEHLGGRVVSHVLAREDVETAAVLYAKTVGRGEGSALVIHDMATVPEHGYAERRRDRLSIDPVALNRLVRTAREASWSVITVHSHPGTTVPWFSWADDASDVRLLPSFGAQVPGVPHGSMVLAGNGEARLRLLAANELAATELNVVGRRLLTMSPAPTTEASEEHHRQRLALGEVGHAALRRLRVGVVGLGGTGSVVAAQLSHLGVGALVLMDADALERSNLSRVFGATLADIGRAKVDVAARYAAGLGVNAVALRRPLASTGDGAALTSCDVVFSCVDKHVPRALLNRLAYEALVPVIDLGTVFRVGDDGSVTGEGGRVVIAGPGRPCFACWGVLDAERLRVEQLSPEERERGRTEGYIEGADVPQPAVVSFNTAVAGAAVTEFLRMVTAFAGADAPPDRLAFSFSSGTARRVSLAARPQCRICGGLQNGRAPESTAPLC